MASVLPPKLPIIRFSEDCINPGSCLWGPVQEQVVRALEEYGCFEALYEGIPTQLHDDVLLQMRDLFNLPAETKCRFVDARKPFNGYHPNLPHYEAVGISGVLDSGVIQQLSDLMWPHGNPKFCETLNSYARRVLELDLWITKMVFEALGVERYLDSHTKSLNYSIRVTKYEAHSKTKEDQIRARTHCDKNFLTILQQNQVNGLQVLTSDGKWIEATPSASSFMVMLGESFLGWSNGRLHCPQHRVMIRGNDSRYSIGLFSAIGGVIECPEELVDAEHPQLFKPFDEIGLLRFYQTDKDHKTGSTLKAFFSI